MKNIASNEVAGRYVKALYELSLEEKKKAKIKEDIVKINLLINKNKELKEIIHSPLITSKKHQEILLLISKALKLDKITENFLFLLAFNKRLNLLNKISKIYDESASDQKDIVKIDVILPNKISKKDILEINNKLKPGIRKKTKINFIQDKKIISGFIIKLGSTMIDFSMKSKLEKIVNSLR